MKKHNVFKILLLISPLLFLFMGSVYLSKWAQKPIVLHEEVLVTLAKGTSLQSLSQDLKVKGLVSNARIFNLWVRLHKGVYEHFIAGTYRFTDSVSPQNIMDTMKDGKIYNPLVLELTIPEGSTVAQVRAHLIQLGVGTQEEFLKLEKDKAWLESLNIKYLEGFLFPATYSFYLKKPTPQEAYERAVHEFFVRLPEHYKEDLQSHNLTLEDWVNFASLIEKETYAPEERKKVSEVIWRRLKVGMPLGIDASLIYGIKDYNGNIKRSHLEDESNLYNTRIHKGLPPTAIASPSLGSLEAVFYPTNEGYYYYVLIPGPEKLHHFSKNFKEHRFYVDQLVRAQRQMKNTRASTPNK